MMLNRLRRRFALTLRRRPLLPFLLAATLAVDLVLVVAGLADFEEFGIPMAFAHLGLLGVWAGQLRSRWKVRCLVTVGAMVVVSALFMTSNGSDGEAFTIFLGFGFVVAALTAATRYAGRVWRHRRGAASREPVRYSIAGILTATTVVAVLATLLRFVEVPQAPLWVASVCLPLAVLPIIAHDLVRRFGFGGTAVFTVLGSAFVCGVLFILILRRTSPPDSAVWIVATVLQGGFYLLWLLGLRVRLHKLAPERPPAPRLVVTTPEPVSEDSPVEDTIAPAPLDLEG